MKSWPGFALLAVKRVHPMRGLVAVALALAAVSGQADAARSAVPATLQTPGEHYQAGSMEDHIDLLVRDGFDLPAAAIAHIEALASEQRESPTNRRVALQARGMIEAQAGHVADAEATAQDLLELYFRTDDPLAAAGAALVRALVAETGGQLDRAAFFARAALGVYQLSCAALAPAGGPARAMPAGVPCEYRSAWRALHIMERRSLSLGQIVQARSELVMALELAECAGDVWRKAYDLSALGFVASRNGQPGEADRLTGEARRAAIATGDPVLMARLRSNEARVADSRGDHVGALRMTEEALSLAHRAQAGRMEALLLVNMSDLYTKLGRPLQALQSAESALATVRRFNDQRAERIVINNAGLAKIGLGRIAEGKQDLSRLLQLWRASDAMADEAATLREYGQALAAAGDARGALDLFHQERAVTADVVRRSREAALKEMQARDDAQAKLRNIDLLNRDNALKTEALANHTQLLKNWAVLALVLAAAVVLVTLLYRRVRSMQRELEATEARLREQSQRDALTNLANRRHLHAVMDATVTGEPSPPFEGAMLLIDIDHFKAINDAWGHAAGDAVLVEFGRRLTDTVRSGDLVVRWGGEEFLIIASGLSAAQGHELAARLLERINGDAFDVVGQTLHVTASIGYGRFPLVGRSAELPWQQGVNLVDIALYSAKREGRNRAMGIVTATEEAPQGLRRIAADSGQFKQTRPMELLQTCGWPG
ncbi:hypothetical protein BH11PSE8_BH11PSE8_00890 [soil metagenome]